MPDVALHIVLLHTDVLAICSDDIVKLLCF